jgi:histidinol-phosphate/aromatic aminotransferase/cobyric acid decarboxylase-like protein
MKTHGGRAPRGVVDFSSSLNPLGPPRELHEAIAKCLGERVYARYPDYEYRALKSRISSFYGLDPGDIVLLNGSAEAYTLVLTALKPKTIVSVEPTFGDHQHASRALNIRLEPVFMRPDPKSWVLDASSLLNAVKIAPKPCLVILSNPNNPTGSHVSPWVLEQVALHDGCYLLVDEAYLDFTSLGSSYKLGLENVLSVRSLTKIFSVPGLRLGFLAVRGRIAKLLEELRPAWNVNSIAACSFESFLGEHESLAAEFVEKSRRLVEYERSRLAKRLGGIRGLRVYDSLAPYMLIRHDKLPHPRFQRELVRRGLYVRDCSSFLGLGSSYSRVSVKLREENDKLVESLGELLG